VNETIGIVLALYNGERYLEEQLDSILAQTYTEWKLYICDDGSTDKSLSVVKKYANLYPEKIIIMEHQKPNVGATLNFSRLACYIKEQYIMFCDQDDIWVDKKVEISYNAIKKLESNDTKTPALFFCDLQVIDESGNIKAASFWRDQKLDPRLSQDLYSLLALNVVTGSTIIINNALKSVTFPIPTPHIVHDHWLAVMACYHGKISYTKEPLVRYRQHEKNILGAPKIDIYYFMHKIFFSMLHVNKTYEKYRYIPFKINIFFLLYKKLTLNMQRIFNA